MIARQFAAMFKARTMEFVRDRGSLIWNIVFPVLLVFGFAFAIDGSKDRLFKVGLIDAPPAAQVAADARTGAAGLPAVLADEQVQLINYDAKETPRAVVLKRLAQHQIEMAVDLAGKRFWINPESPKSRLLQRLAVADGGGADFAVESVSGQAVRYVDWLVPGAIGMNMLFSCLFGVGYVIVRYRKNGVLKRLKATPVSALGFVAAQGASRFVIVLATAVLVYAGTNLFLRFAMSGSYLLLLLVTALAIVSMIALGLVFAARFKNEELANGLMNLLTFPMIIFSGVFFSLEGAPDFVQKAAQIFPLSHFTSAARQIMLDGAGLAAVAPDIAFLGVFSLAAVALSAWLFKWE